MPRLNFFSDCVGWPRDQVPDLSAMIRAGEKITRETFLKHVDPQEMKRIEQELGYERDSRRGLTMAKDWHVAYFKSTLRGCPAVYFVWSAIEYVFTDLSCLRSSPEKESSDIELGGPSTVPATKAEAKKAWRRTKTLLVKEARHAFQKGEIWGESANGYPVVVSVDGEWAIGFGKKNDNVFGFDVFALHPELPRGDANLWSSWQKN